MEKVTLDVDYEPETEISKDERIRNTVADILAEEPFNLTPNQDQWSVTSVYYQDGEPFLALVAANKPKRDEPEPDPRIYGKLRGPILDLKNKGIYGRSLGWAPTVEMSEIVPDKHGRVPITTLDGEEILDADGNPPHIRNMRLQYAVDGVFIRTLLVPDEVNGGGKVLLATYKKFDPKRSTWDKSRDFVSLFQSMGLDVNTLYDTSKKYSPVVHTFLVSDPALWVTFLYRTGSPDNLGPGFMVYVGDHEIWNEEACPFPHDEVDFEIRTPSGMTDELILNNTTPFIYNPEESLNLPTANKHLKRSWENEDSINECNTDPRLLPGGALVVYLEDEDQNVERVFKISSPAERWRAEMRHNVANVKRSLYDQRDFLREKFGGESSYRNLTNYRKNFPTLEKRPMDDVVAEAKEWELICWETVDTPLTERKEMLGNLLKCFVMSVPWHRRPEILSFWRDMLNDQSRLASWIAANFRNSSPAQVAQKLDGYDERVIERINKMLGFAKAESERTGGQKMALSYALDKALQQERGESLYRLVRVMDMTNENGMVELEAETVILEPAATQPKRSNAPRRKEVKNRSVAGKPNLPTRKVKGRTDEP